MMKALFILLFFVPLYVHAATFVVTTNVANGNGSLHQALEQAAQNGTTVTDSIRFNLAEGQTTITLSTSLTLSSNLIIDGTTQPGVPFGNTDARVRIQASGCMIGFVMDGINRVEIYGLWFSDFNTTAPGCSSAAISMRNTDRFTLGKPTKGNCFTNNLFSIFNPSQSPNDFTENTNIRLQSNRIGMDTATRPDFASSTLAFGSTRNLFFGGTTANEGNRIGNAFINVGNQFAPLSVAGDSIVFANNSFGFDPFNGDLLSTIGLHIIGYQQGGSKLNVLVENNKIGKDDAANKVWITNITGNLIIRDNYIGSLNTAITPGEIASAIYLANCEKKDSIVIRNNIVNGYTSAVLVLATKDVTITNNSFYCNRKAIDYKQIEDVPIISFDELTTTNLKGTTQPLNKVEIYSTTSCAEFCENGRTLLATVISDANGAFSYAGILPGKISATATTPTGTTGEFYGPKFSTSAVEFRDATCGQNNGYVKGIRVIKGNTFFWEDDNGIVVSNDTSIYNLKPGRYRFVLKDSLSSCPEESPYYVIKSVSKPSVDSTFSVVNTRCGKSAGRIISEGNLTAGGLSLWQDSAYNNLQMGGDSISNLPPGTYFYKAALQVDTTCATPYGPFVILDQPGPELNTSNAIITASQCGKSTGSITNITFTNNTGTATFVWQDSAGKVVSNTLDLIDQPTGKYRLLYKDQSVCDTISSEFFTINSRGQIDIDTTNRVIKPASCKDADGSITGLKVFGADYMQWINANDQPSGTGPDLLLVPSGEYRLTGINALGCKDTSVAMFVPQSIFQVLATQQEVVPPHCDLANGYIRLTNFSADTANYSFAWRDTVSGASLGGNTFITGLSSGYYTLTATDNNSCSNVIFERELVQVGTPSINESSVLLQQDTCSQGVGAIENIDVSGGQKPYTWRWFRDNAAMPFAQTAQFVSGISTGAYQLIVSDAFSCADTSTTFVINSVEQQLPSPQAPNQSVLRNTSATFMLPSQPGNYLLFDTVTATIPIRRSTGQQISTPIVSYDKTFYLQYSVGSCISQRVAVSVRIYDKAMIVLPNAFSPNGDGMNDVWKMQAQGLLTLKEWTVFNRYGQIVFTGKDATQGWDGNIKGSAAPVGTYYWLATGTDNDGKVLKASGSVTLLR